MTQEKNYINVAKGIGAILVIVGHAMNLPYEICCLIYGFHMPLFFMISGYLYNQKKWEKEGLWALIKRRFKSYVIPYFSLCFVCWIINMFLEYHDGYRGEAFTLSIKYHLFYIFYSVGLDNKMPQCSPLWYLLLAFLCSIAFYLLMKLPWAPLRIAIMIGGIAWNNWWKDHHFLEMPWHLNLVLVGAAFMYIGFLIQKWNLLEMKHFNLIWALLMVYVAYRIIMENGRIDLNMDLMQRPWFIYLGATLMVFPLLWFCKSYLNGCRILAFYGGTTTFVVMGFNKLLNILVKRSWAKLPFGTLENLPWWINSIAVIILCGLLSLCWSWLKKCATMKSVKSA